MLTSVFLAPKPAVFGHVGIAQAAGQQGALDRITAGAARPAPGQTAAPCEALRRCVVWTEVWTNLWTVSPHQNSPPPPLYLGFGGGPEPDYPPSTCCVRVVWLGSLVFGSATGAGA